MTGQDWLLAAGNHLWQTTAFAGIAAALTIALRRNSARVRHWVWLVVSLKFLVPFSLLVALGSQFHRQIVLPPPPEKLATAVTQAAQPFQAAAGFEMNDALTKTESVVPAILFTVWLLGSIVVLSFWIRRWWRVRLAMRGGRLAELGLEVTVLEIPAQIEPGVFGLFRPVLLLPAGIRERLLSEHLAEIVAHELCHIRRRDNVAASAHMLVEAAFWFHPLVWWVGARLVEERERACDEEVVHRGSKPELYAESILKTCEFYLESPVACMAGISGADLKERITRIMARETTNGLSLGRKLILTGAALATVGVPMSLGLMHLARPTQRYVRSVVEANAPGGRAMRLQIRMLAPLEARAQVRGAVAAAVPALEVTSITPSHSVRTLGETQLESNGRFAARGVTIGTLIQIAYGVNAFQIARAPGWVEEDRYDVEIGPKDLKGGDVQVDPEQRQRQIAKAIQSLLTRGYKLKVHHEMREAPTYSLVVAKDGPRFEHLAPLHSPERVFSVAFAGHPTPQQLMPIDPFNTKEGGSMFLEKANMQLFAQFLSNYVGGLVVDKTGLNDLYTFPSQVGTGSGRSLRRHERAHAG